jgi:hypothetical protein
LTTDGAAAVVRRRAVLQTLSENFRRTTSQVMLDFPVGHHLFLSVVSENLGAVETVFNSRSTSRI